jgi:hypothetical protein
LSVHHALDLGPIGKARFAEYGLCAIDPEGDARHGDRAGERHPALEESGDLSKHRIAAEERSPTPRGILRVELEPPRNLAAYKLSALFDGKLFDVLFGYDPNVFLRCALQKTLGVRENAHVALRLDQVLDLIEIAGNGQRVLNTCEPMLAGVCFGASQARAKHIAAHVEGKRGQQLIETLDKLVSGRSSR